MNEYIYIYIHIGIDYIPTYQCSSHIWGNRGNCLVESV